VYKKTWIAVQYRYCSNTSKNYVSSRNIKFAFFILYWIPICMSVCFPLFTKKTKLRGLESASELYRASDRRLSAKLLPTFADRGYRVVSVTDPYGRSLGFLDRSRYYLSQVAPQLSSRGWVDPVPEPILLRESGSAGNRTRTSGSVARNSEH
jgi:hypothetical protein